MASATIYKYLFCSTICIIWCVTSSSAAITVQNEISIKNFDSVISEYCDCYTHIASDYYINELSTTTVKCPISISNTSSNILNSSIPSRYLKSNQTCRAVLFVFYNGIQIPGKYYEDVFVDKYKGRSGSLYTLPLLSAYVILFHINFTTDMNNKILLRFILNVRLNIARYVLVLEAERSISKLQTGSINSFSIHKSHVTVHRYAFFTFAYSPGNVRSTITSIQNKVDQKNFVDSSVHFASGLKGPHYLTNISFFYEYTTVIDFAKLYSANSTNPFENTTLIDEIDWAQVLALIGTQLKIFHGANVDFIPIKAHVTWLTKESLINSFNKNSIQTYWVDENILWFFATCDGTGASINFSIFHQVYDLVFWLLLGISVSFIASVLTLVSYFHAKHGWRDVCVYWLRYAACLLCLLIEVSQKLPLYLNQAHNSISRTHKLTFGVWFLMVVVITNAYKGILVSDVTSPLQSRGTWNIIKSMDGFHFYVSEEMIPPL